MWDTRGQGGPVSVVLTVVIVAMVALLGIVLFAEFAQTITITGPLSEAEESLVEGVPNALKLAVGGTGIAVTAVLLLLRAGG